MYALYHLLRQFYTRQPDVLRRAQVLTGVDNPVSYTHLTLPTIYSV